MLWITVSSNHIPRVSMELTYCQKGFGCTSFFLAAILIRAFVLTYPVEVDKKNINERTLGELSLLLASYPQLFHYDEDQTRTTG
jgi:hypothetical protein